MGWCIVLGILIVVLWLRDERKKAPTKEDVPIVPMNYAPGKSSEYHVPTTRKETDELLSACGIVPGFSKDYTKDEEFCKKHPCDYMVPYRFPNGTLTYKCTNEAMWERFGIRKKILQNLNEGCFEQCARCSGLACYGERKSKSATQP